MEINAKIMRIRTDYSGLPYKLAWNDIWDEVSQGVTSFDANKVLESNFIVLTNVEGQIFMIVEPYSVQKFRRDPLELRIQGFPLNGDFIGQPDPCPDNQERIVFNW